MELRWTELTHTGDDDLPVILVGPGLGTGVKALWSDVAKELEGRFEVRGYDLPGHAGAPVHHEPFRVQDITQAVVDVARHLKAACGEDSRKVFFAGLSLSGGVALELAAKHASVVDGVALVCSAAKIGDATVWEHQAKDLEKAGMPMVASQVKSSCFAPGFAQQNLAKAQEMLNAINTVDLTSYVTVCRALGGYDMRAQLASIRIPVLAVNGAHDKMCPPSSAEIIANEVAHGEAAVLENSAHWAPVEEPAALAGLLGEFFSRC